MNSTATYLGVSVGIKDEYLKAMDSMPMDLQSRFGVDFAGERSEVCQGRRAGMSHASSLATEAAREADSFLRRIVSEYLGRTDWTPGDLQGRCQWIVAEHANPGMKTFYIDGVALFSMRRHPAVQIHDSKAVADLGIERH